MKIGYIITQTSSARRINEAMAQMLRDAIPQQAGCLLAPKTPDVVHVFGAYDARTARLVGNYAKRGTPVVFTAIGGLPSIATLSAARRSKAKKIARQATAVHVCGSMEQTLINELAPDTVTCVVANPSLSHIITESDATKAVTQLYERTVKRHNERVEKEIKERLTAANVVDASVAHVCRNIILVYRHLKRGYIDLRTLKNLVTLMTETAYDEEILADTLRRTHLLSFARSLMAALEQEAGLTEGFMPIQPKNGKLARRIARAIVNE